MAADNGWAGVDAPWVEIERAILPNVFDVPPGSVGRPEDIARAVAFCAVLSPDT